MFYGCKPPQVDVRDYKIKATPAQAEALPAEFCLEKCMRIKNQGYVGSCVAHSTSTILEYHTHGKNKLSTAFIYGIQRKLCGSDGPGMHLSDACKIVKKYGDMLESDCSGNYEVPEAYSHANEAYADEAKLAKAKKYHIDSYYTCGTNNDIKYAIQKYGPVLGCVAWYDDYSVDELGRISFNLSSDYGYHAITIIGWSKEGFICQNSWGKNFGQGGYFILPYIYKVAEAKAIIDAPDEDDEALCATDIPNALTLICKFLNALINFINSFNQ